MKTIIIELSEIDHETFRTKALNEDHRNMKGQATHLVLKYIRETSDVKKDTKKDFQQGFTHCL